MYTRTTLHEIQWVAAGKDPASLNPTRLDHDQWADVAVSAKMEYAVLTMKQIDGLNAAPNRDGRMDDNGVVRLRKVGELYHP